MKREPLQLLQTVSHNLDKVWADLSEASRQTPTPEIADALTLAKEKTRLLNQEVAAIRDKAKATESKTTAKKIPSSW